MNRFLTQIHRISKLFLAIPAFALLVFILFSFSTSTQASFYDVPSDSIFAPHINELFTHNLITGYTDLNGNPTGKYGPNNTIKRSEFAKISAIIKLAELYGNEEGWQDMSEDMLIKTLESKMKYYHQCSNPISSCSTTYGADLRGVCNVCSITGGVPFPDVGEDQIDCQSKGICNWYLKYVYYLARKGTVKGYQNYNPPKYIPTNDILRIHALKMIIVDNGNISPESDARYSRLSSLADSKKSNTPKCIYGAESYIRDRNGGDTEDSNKLLKYAVLADRLDLFGNDCQVITDAGYDKSNPKEVAHFLQQEVLRKEIPRYLSITTSYTPIEPDPVTDTTINTKEENLYTETIADEPYEIPIFIDPTPDGNENTGIVFTETSTTETILKDNTRIILNKETGQYTVQDIATGTVLETGTAEEGTVVQEIAETINTVVLEEKVEEQREMEQGDVQVERKMPRIPEAHRKQIEDNPQEEIEEVVIADTSKASIITTKSIQICTGSGCETIPAGKVLDALAVTKSRSGNYYQNVNYDGVLYQVNCDDVQNVGCVDAGWRQDTATETVVVDTEPGDNPLFDIISPSYYGEGVDSFVNWVTELNNRMTQIKQALESHYDKGNTVEKTKNWGLVGKDRDNWEYNYVVRWAEAKKVEEALEALNVKRLFKTSIAKVNIRMETKAKSHLLKTISAEKTGITVIGKAVRGEYVDAYKTDRWYMVKCDECKDRSGKVVAEGYVLTTLLHAVQLGDKDTNYVKIDDKFSHSGFNRGKSKVTGIVLHATLGNGSAANDRNSIKKSGRLNGVGAHYYVDRDGNIAQALPDYKKIHHAGYNGPWPNVRKNGSNFTIGIEISNYGPIKIEAKNNETIKKNAYNRNTNVDTLNVKSVYSKVWKVWSYFQTSKSKGMSGNVTWAGFGTNANEKVETWQTYTEKQLKSVVLLLDYLEERYGIPSNNFFEYSNPNTYDGLSDAEIKKNSHYYYPRNAEERKKYNDLLYDWNGIYQHHNVTGKFDAGPGLNIDELTRVRKELFSE